LSLNTTV